MTADATTLIRLSTPADVVEAVPHLVGFQPEDSLVVIALRGERRRLGIVARLDLVEIWSGPHRAERVLEFLRRDGASNVLLVFYPPSDGRDHASIGPTLRALDRVLTPAGITVLDAVCVFEGRWYSLLCAEPLCCPVDGTPVERETPSAIAVANIASGRVTLGSREELERTIAPLAGAAADAASAALARAKAALDQLVERQGRLSTVDETISLLAEAVEARLPGDHPRADGLALERAARLIVGLSDVRARDEMLRWVGDDWGEATRGLLIELAPMALPPFEVEPLTALAWVCYLQGDGGLAGMAIDRLRASGVATRMIDMLDQVVSAGVNPEMFRDAVRDPARLRERR